jgi:hypothetical protein
MTPAGAVHGQAAGRLDVGGRPVRGELVPVFAGERRDRGEGAALVFQDCRVAVDFELHDGEYHLDVVFVDDLDGVHLRLLPVVAQVDLAQGHGLAPAAVVRPALPVAPVLDLPADRGAVVPAVEPPFARARLVVAVDAAEVQIDQSIELRLYHGLAELVELVREAVGPNGLGLVGLVDFGQPTIGHPVQVDRDMSGLCRRLVVVAAVVVFQVSSRGG